MGEQKQSRLQRICNIAKYVVLAGIVLSVLILAFVIGLLAIMFSDSTMTAEDLGRNESFFLFGVTLVNQVISILLFYYLYQLTKSLGSENSPFISENVWLLKKMAILLLTGWTLVTVAGFIISVLWSLPITGINGDALLMAGIIYVISLVFEYGVRLQEESDGFV
jgi:hypothetical protein